MTLDYEDLLENMGEGLYFVDQARRITRWNRAAERISGFSRDEVLGSTCYENVLVHVDERGCNLCATRCPLADTLRDGVARQHNLFLHHKEGYRLPVRVRVSPLRDAEGRLVGAAELFTDQSDENLLLSRLREIEALSMLDSLTQLANRRFIEQELARRIAEAERYGFAFGFLFMDIDRFKRVNDAHGHGAGDRALQTVARSLTACCRSFDVLGRWGGEEFVCIVRQVDEATLHDIAERFRAIVAASVVHVEGADLQVTLSLGGTTYQRGDTPAGLVARADGLMYRSKQGGRNRVTIEAVSAS